MTNDFYRAFEDKHRGSRDLIKLRLQVYLPFVLPLLATFPNGLTLDIGCGRGEWLELLNEYGFDARGVDIDDGMLEACVQLDLKAENADALTFLKSAKDESYCVVSGFHIAEHLPFDYLRGVVQEAKRVLVPGGLLILETPNPENISVGTNSFYLDPTHQKPIPPDLLSFLPEYYGFERTKVLRLQEDPGLKVRENASLDLLSVLSGVSPDFAVVCQKSGNNENMMAIIKAFSNVYGLTLSDLAGKYHAGLQERIEMLDTKTQLQAEQLILLIKTQELKAQLEAVYSSSSWQLTSPLRWLSIKISLFKPSKILKKTTKYIIKLVSTKPKLRTFLSRLVARSAILQKVKKTTFIFQDNDHTTQVSFDSTSQMSFKPNHGVMLTELTPRAREIYTKLKALTDAERGDRV